MSSDKIYLSREEQAFLMDMLEINNPTDACEKFATLLVEERANPADLKKYLIKIMKKMKKWYV